MVCGCLCHVDGIWWYIEFVVSLCDGGVIVGLMILLWDIME